MSTIANFPKLTRVPVNGIELEVFETGQENKGNPIVLCHGWPSSAKKNSQSMSGLLRQPNFLAASTGTGIWIATGSFWQT